MLTIESIKLNLKGGIRSQATELHRTWNRKRKVKNFKEFHDLMSKDMKDRTNNQTIAFILDSF